MKSKIGENACNKVRINTTMVKNFQIITYREQSITLKHTQIHTDQLAKNVNYAQMWMNCINGNFNKGIVMTVIYFDISIICTYY